MAMTNVCETGKGERKGTDNLLVLEWPKHHVFHYCRKILYLQILQKKKRTQRKTDKDHMMKPLN